MPRAMASAIARVLHPADSHFTFLQRSAQSRRMGKAGSATDPGCTCCEGTCVATPVIAGIYHYERYLWGGAS